jgi:hypothetical protein
VEAGQKVQVVAAAKLIRSTVKLQLAKNLISNGDLQLWTADNLRPLNWILGGSPTIAKIKGPTAGTTLLRLKGVGAGSNQPQDYLLSPAIPHLPGDQEDTVTLFVTAELEGNTSSVVGVKPPANVANQRIELVADGVVVGEDIVLTWNSDDKQKTQKVPLPLGLPGVALRVRIYPPERTAGPDLFAPVQLRIAEVGMMIQPGLVEWPEQEVIDATNFDGIFTGIILPDLELVHADMPRLPQLDGSLAPLLGMDVYAWRHALSLADFRATTKWKRPTSSTGLSLLDNSAEDRLELRAKPIDILLGEVQGPGVSLLGVGLMLDAVHDADGKFLIVGCTQHVRSATATLVLRKMRAGTYTIPFAYPDRLRITRLGARKAKPGWRIVGEPV